MLWTEKYRPNKISDIVGQKSFVVRANGWITKKEMPNLLLSGVVGTGKTSGAIALARDMLGENFTGNFLELNSSDDRKIETVRTKIKDFASIKGIGSIPFKILLLDEADGMTKDAQKALRRIMEKFSSNVRFILTCNDDYKIIDAIKSRCEQIFFPRLSDDEVAQVIESIAVKEEVGGSGFTAIDSVKKYNGDLRSAINGFQASHIQDTFGLRSRDEQVIDYHNVLVQIVAKNKNLLEIISDLIVKGITVKQICIGIHDEIVKSGLSNEDKYRILRVIGETEYRCDIMTPRVVASWMIAQLN